MNTYAYRQYHATCDRHEPDHNAACHDCNAARGSIGAHSECECPRCYASWACLYGWEMPR